MERTAGPGPRKEIGDAESSQLHPPHVTENDRGAQFQADSPAPNDVAGPPATAHGRDAVDSANEVRQVDDESAYERRPGEDKDRAETDMP
ncbi:hypothetical protein [Longimicrobium sp.]|uniref:hypothetical protein n=1 Tax=Longimicrobium sp. TaxID=2029185 RepID=UPI002E2F440B|nr:hypothetical protein [Longimicrobium sp.]HEX6038201.1 hypothetical protein [Longimicrobium sp.]